MASLDLLRGQVPPGAGPIGLQSGDEYHRLTRDFDRRLLELTGPRVAILNCADHRAAPHSTATATKHFAALGADAFPLEVVDHGTPNARAVSPIAADLLYIGGGSPRALLGCIKDTPLWKEVVERWGVGMGIAGASAGAMVLCPVCLVPEEGARVPTIWADGTALLTARVAIAPHASSRPREWIHEVARTAPVPLLALDDHTGIILREDAAPEVIGPGDARVVQPSE